MSEGFDFSHLTSLGFLSSSSPSLPPKTASCFNPHSLLSDSHCEQKQGSSDYPLPCLGPEWPWVVHVLSSSSLSTATNVHNVVWKILRRVSGQDYGLCQMNAEKEAASPCTCQDCQSSSDNDAFSGPESEYQYRDTLLQLLESHVPEAYQEIFYTHLIPFMVHMVNQTPVLFPSGTLSRVCLPASSDSTPASAPASASVSISRLQATCLLCNMFFCTTTRGNVVSYWANFGAWYMCKIDSTHPIVAYFQTLVMYIEMVWKSCVEQGVYMSPQESHTSRRQGDRQTDALEVSENAIHICLNRESVSKCREELLCSVDPLCDLRISTKGRIGDDITQVQVDFANKCVSFGRGGTQEEIIFGMSPELHICALVCAEMGPMDALTVYGAIRVGDYSGYGLDVKSCGRFEYPKGVPYSNTITLMMDALNMYDVYSLSSLEEIQAGALDPQRRVSLNQPELSCDSEDRILDVVNRVQLSDACVCRELLKSFAAFRSLSNHPHPHPSSEADANRNTETTLHSESKSGDRLVVGIGHWGCGAFGGNRYIKSLILWMTLSICQLDGVYFTFGENQFSQDLLQLRDAILADTHSIDSTDPYHSGRTKMTVSVFYKSFVDVIRVVRKQLEEGTIVGSGPEIGKALFSLILERLYEM